MRREFRAICCCPNIFCHKMVTSGPILKFQMSTEPYWYAQHDRIFENGATAFLVAKIGTKRFIHIWVVLRATELKFGIQAEGSPFVRQILIPITWQYFGMVPLPSWWQKLELKDLSISELFEELLSWNSESKLIIPKYSTGIYFQAIGAIFFFVI